MGIDKLPSRKFSTKKKFLLNITHNHPRTLENYKIDEVEKQSLC